MLTLSKARLQPLYTTQKARGRGLQRAGIESMLLVSVLRTPNAALSIISSMRRLFPNEVSDGGWTKPDTWLGEIVLGEREAVADIALLEEL